MQPHGKQTAVVAGVLGTPVVEILGEGGALYGLVEHLTDFHIAVPERDWRLSRSVPLRYALVWE